MTVIGKASRTLRQDVSPRAEELEYPTDSKGCVICPTPTPSGPKCKDGEEQLMRTQTCEKCPEYYCSPVDGSGGSQAPIGPIVGGTVGGVVALIVAGLLYYFLVWKKKHPSLDDDEDFPLSDLENDQDDKGSSSNESNVNVSMASPTPNGSGTISGTGGSGSADTLRNSSGATLDKPSSRRTKMNNNPNRRLSSYESFTRPQTRYKNRLNPRQVRKTGQRQIKSQNLVQSPYMDPNSNHRNSMATTISTTNASNILPIAYIPGVTVRPTKNNTKSIYSYETESIFSDLNTIENASIIGDIMKANNYNGQESQQQRQQQQQPLHQLQEEQEPGENNGAGDNTMTAIRGQPRLVNVDRIEEEEEDDDDDDDLSDLESNTYSVKRNISGELSKSGGEITTTTNHLNDSTLSNITDDIQEEDEDMDSDSDVDSDIGEIQRATSVRKTTEQVKQIRSEPEVIIDRKTPQEIPIDLIDLGKPPKHEEGHASNHGSFILDVEIDNKRPNSQTSGEKSPFEDP